MKFQNIIIIFVHMKVGKARADNKLPKPKKLHDKTCDRGRQYMSLSQFRLHTNFFSFDFGATQTAWVLPYYGTDMIKIYN